MGARGPKPKPTELKILAGNPGKRKLTKKEPRPPCAVPKCPTYLTGIAKDEWNRVVNELFRLKIMTNLDAQNLAGMCQALKRAVAADKELDSGLTEKGVQGTYKAKPEVQISRDSWAEYRKFASEFGMSPASRARIQIESGNGEDEEDAQDEEDFFSPE